MPQKCMLTAFHYLSEYLIDSAANPTWTAKPLALEKASLRLCGDGRVVQCLDIDWNPLIIATAQDMDSEEEKIDSFPFPVFLSLINGNLQIVR